MIFKSHLQTDLRLCEAKEKDSIASGLTINGEYVLSGKKGRFIALRLLITIRRITK